MTTGAQAVLGSRTVLRRQVIRFAGVGVVSTVLHLGLFAILVGAGMSSQLANGLSLVVGTLANTAANRSWTFGVTGRERVVTHHGQALVVFAITWAATSVALSLLAALAPGTGAVGQTVVVAMANAVSTVARFVAMRSWIFRSDPAPR
jgi:putative flippase GtrA